MGQDISFINIITGSGFSTNIGINPKAVTGNQLLANIFEITFMTNITDSLLSNGHGGNAINTISKGYNTNDLQSLSAMVKIAIDETVSVMTEDQDKYGSLIPNTEKLQSASLQTITKVSDQVSITIKIIPEEYEVQTVDSLLVVLPL